MGKAALLALATFTIASSYYALASRDAETGAGAVTSNHQMTVLARNGALAGYEQARQAIADAGSLLPFIPGASLQGGYDGASYAVTITSDGSTATIESTGTESNGQGDVSFTIEAVVGWHSSRTDDVPPFLNYALITEQSLVLNGNVNGYVDDPGSRHNADFHTNANLHVNGNAAEVAGFGTYVGLATSTPPSALENTFQPHYNPDGLDSVYRTGAVDIPAFDASSFLEGVEVDETTDGNVHLAGPLDPGGTRDDPYVWYVRGDLTTDGGATVEGYVMFVVEGEIDLAGNLTAGGPAAESTIALYAGGDVTLSGTIRVYGQIYTDGNVVFNGTPDVHGSVASGALAVLNGTPALHYRPPSPTLSSIFSDPPELRLLSYFEH